MSAATTSGPLVIVGAGGFGREVLDVVEAVNAHGGALEFRGFLDDGDVDATLLEWRGAELLGPTTAAEPSLGGFAIGIGNGRVRAAIDLRLQAVGLYPVTLVHPSASLGSANELGAGSVLTAGARVTTNVILGSHVHLNLNCTVGHDCVVGDFVSVYPGATISGNVTLGRAVTVGTGANILPGVTIGDGAFVGAGAVVTRDVEPGTTVLGSPARPLKR